MILYHFTSAESLDAILRDGLVWGNINLSQHTVLNGVWFTTVTNPHGHGLTFGDEVTEQERRNHFARWGQPFPKHVTHWPDKRAVRIKVVIPSRDPRLVRWSTWGKKRCDPRLFDFLRSADGEGWNYKMWFIYLGVVEPSRFSSVEFRDKSGQYKPQKFLTPCV